MLGVIGPIWIRQQNARLQFGAMVFANPGEFEFLFLGHPAIQILT
jgi:hypothetical protein